MVNSTKKRNSLQAYLDNQGMSAHAFSKYIGMSKTTIYRLLKGKKPRRHVASRIEGSTMGLVTLQDFGYE